MHSLRRSLCVLAPLTLLSWPALSLAADAPDPKAASYSLGLYFGTQLHSAGLQQAASMEDLDRGLRDGMAGKTASDEDKQRMSEWLKSGMQQQAVRNRAEAQAFMAENGKIAGVVTTTSGLQYTIVKAGDEKARSPVATDRVTVHYRGRLLDGSVFDSSDSHASPATFSLNGGVIAGWKEALQLMKPGAQWRVFVPPDLAYGDHGRPNIPAGALLVFDMELVNIEAPGIMSPENAAAGANKPIARPAPKSAPKPAH